MDDTSKTLKSWVTFAGCVLVVVVLYWAQAVLVPIALAILLTFVLDASGHLARTVDRPRPGRSRDRHAGVHGPRSRRLGSGAADELSGRGPAPLPRQHPGEDRGRARRGQGRFGREAAGDDRGHQDRPRKVDVPKGTVSRPVVVTSEQVTGFSGFVVARSHRRPAGHGRARGGDGHLHAARTPGSARPADRAVRARPAGRHDEGVRRGGHSRQPAAVDAVPGQSGLRHRRRRRALLPRRAVPVGLGGAGCGSPIHPVRRARARRRRADPGQPGGRRRAGPVRSGSSVCSSCSSCSRISCSRRCCMPGRPASRRWRCSCPWRSGRGCGDRSACSWRRR